VYYRGVDQFLRWGRDAVLLGLFAALPVLGLAALDFFVRARRSGRSGAAEQAFLDALLAISVIGVLVVGLRPGMGTGPGWEQWNLIPFRDLLRSFDGPGWGIQLALANIVGNFVLYIPFGISMRLRFSRLNVWHAAIVAAAVSLTVEVGQAIEASGRSSDVTDVIMNAAGGTIGFALANIVRPYVSNLAAHGWSRRT
jgi:hypothetical protein